MLKHLLTAASVALLITLTAVSAANAEPPLPFDLGHPGQRSHRRRLLPNRYGWQ